MNVSKMKARQLAAMMMFSLTGIGFAGQSLMLTPGATGTMNDRNLPATQAWRVEFQLHDWVIPPPNGNYTYFWQLNGTGAAAAILNDGTLRLLNSRDNAIPCDLPVGNLTNILVRVQRDPVAKRFSCELWNYDGTGYAGNATTFSTASNTSVSGGILGSPYTTAGLAFLRVSNTIVPDGGRPPVTADTGNLLDLKLDRGQQGVTFPGAVYKDTPHQDPVAFMKTEGAPTWSKWVSLRAGYPATLDGTRSFSLADGSAAVSYQWQQLPGGPTTLKWSDHTAAKPVIRGLVFGNYRFQLQVTDANGNTATDVLDVGAVATDDKGIVIQARPEADILFGPMIAFGKNPWPWQDQMNLDAGTQRAPGGAVAYTPPAWGPCALNPSPATCLAGTVSFIPSGINTTYDRSSIAGGHPLGAWDSTLWVTDSSKFDLSTFPATPMILLVKDAQGNQEEIRVCAHTGGSPDQFTACYNGRNWHRDQNAAKAWPVGSDVRQINTVGTGTHFLTDFCPAGPGEAGQIKYSTGTVGVTAGSATVTGQGAAWSTEQESLVIRISGKHGGAPFAFFATVASVNAPGQLTISPAYPSDADTATGLTYAMIQTDSRYVVRHWLRPDGTHGNQYEHVSSCESDTVMYHQSLYANMPAAPQTNQFYSYMDGPGYPFGEYAFNYYDEVLANYASYYRSGNRMFLDNARMVGKYWPKSPDFDETYIGNFPRHMGATGMVAAAVLDGQTSNWYSLRRLATSAINTPAVVTTAGQPTAAGACDADARETAYMGSWLALAALFDPADDGTRTAPGQRSYWKDQLKNMWRRDSDCHGADNSFPAVFWGNNQGVSLTVTQGSVNVTITTGTIPSTMCNNLTNASGTITIKNGSASFTGTGFISAPNSSLVIFAQRGGQYALFQDKFWTYGSPTSGTLSIPADIDSGTYNYQIDSDQAYLSLANPGDQTANPARYHADMNVMHSCQWIDSMHVVLDHPWTSSAGGIAYGAYRSGSEPVGFGQEIFFDGVKTFSMNYAGQVTPLNGDTAPASYASQAAATANYIMITGFDPKTLGLYYSRGLGSCEPVANPRWGGCGYGLDSGGKASARALSGEAQNALRLWYQANPTLSNKTFGDKVYGAQWGKLGGPYFDDTYLQVIGRPSNWGAKWFGFLYGIGMSHQWPAVRLGGVNPAVPVNPSIGVDLGAHPGAVSAQITVTQPSGAQSTSTCSASSCQVAADRRQGAHWYQIAFLNAKGAVVSQTEPDLIDIQ